MVKNQLKEEGLVSDEEKLKFQTLSVKYLGITDGKIGVLSRKVPLAKRFEEEKKPSPQRFRRNQSAKEIIRKPHHKV